MTVNAPGQGKTSYITMTRGGSYGSQYFAPTDEAAEEMADRDGYTVLDITEGEDGERILVVTE